MSSSYFYEINEWTMSVRYGQNLTFYPHFHQNAEFFYSLGGKTKITVGDREEFLRAGDAVLIWPNEVHSYAACPENSYYIGIIDVSVLHEYAPIFAKFDCVDPFLPREKVHPDVARCLASLVQSPEMSTALRHFYLGVVLGRLLEPLPLGEKARPAGQDSLRSLMKYIDTHITEPLTLERLSKELFLNKFYISKLFSQRIGCSLRGYINAIRVSMACALLNDPDVTLPCIMEKCGFDSERTFYRAFRANRGMTPKSYRAQVPRGAPAMDGSRLPGISYGKKPEDSQKAGALP